MRNATILVVRLQGVATEAIKNIVLAGIGKLVVADPGDVVEQDLGAGFFYRDDDVGKKVRVRVRRGGQLAVGAGPRGEDVARTHGPRVLSDPAGPSAYGVRAGRSRPRALSDVNSSGVEAGRFGAIVLGFPFAAGPFPGALWRAFRRRKARTQSLSGRERSWRVLVRWALTFALSVVWRLRSVGTLGPRSYDHSHCHGRV